MSQTQKRTDPRVLRSRRMLQVALVELIQEKDFEELSIREITDRAGLNHATFYLHYSNKLDLLTHCMDEVYQDLMQRFKSIDFSAISPNTPPPGLVEVFRHVQANAAYYKIMLGDKSRNVVMERIRSYFVEISHHRLSVYAKKTRQNIEGQVDLHLSVHFAVGALLGALRWWVFEKNPYSPEEMALQTVRLILWGIYPSLGLKTPDNLVSML